MKRIFLLAAMSVFSAQAMLTEHTKEQVKNVTGYIKPGMYRDVQGFSVMNDGKITRVNMYDVDPSLRYVEIRNLKKISKYINAHKMTNGDITLRLVPHLPGSGPWLAALGYWATKTVCYGTAVAGAGAAVVATGGVAGAVTGAGAAIATGGATAGAGVVGATIAGAGLTTEAATLTAAALTSGTVASTVTAIETAATGVYALLLALPTP